VALLFTLLLVLAPRSYASEVEYRLTGVIGSTSGKVFAVIEDASGQQRLLREGDEIDDGRVGAISERSKTVRLVFPDGEILLGLSGSGREEEFVEEYAIEDYEETGARSFSAEESAELRSLAAEAEKLGERESAARFRELLDLPEDARIVAFDDQKISSTRGMLRSMAKNMSDMAEGGGHFGTISYSSNTGNTRMYLMTELPAHDQP
jgi:hypothetical protein